MGNKKLTGTLIPKDNKKAKMHATFYSDKPIGGGGDSEIFDEYIDATDQQRNTALANVSNQTANTTTGKMGYKVLDSTKTFAEQVTAENTIYEIRDAFDLGGNSITLPLKSTLKFNGGIIKNGTLVGNNSKIEAPEVKIFEQGVYKYRGYVENSSSNSYVSNSPQDLSIQGTWCNTYVSARWFDITNDQSIDVSRRIINMMTLFDVNAEISLPSENYYVFDSININRRFNGNGCTFYQINPYLVYDENIELPSGKQPLDLGDFPSGLVLPYQLLYVSASVKVRNFNVDGINVIPASIGVAENQKWGVYGLFGLRNTNINIECVNLYNAPENAFLGDVNGGNTFKSCIFDGSGEHLFYCHPNNSESIIDCVFRNAGMYNDVAAARIVGYSIKCAQNVESTIEDFTISIIGCRFEENKNGYFALEIEADFLNIDDSVFNTANSTFNKSITKTMVVTINNCKGAPDIGSTLITNCPIIKIYNSIISARLLISAVYIENCIINFDSLLDNVNRRVTTVTDDANKIKKLTVFNCDIVVNDTLSTSRINGVNSVEFINTNFLYNKGIYTMINMVDENAKTEFINCNFTIPNSTTTTLIDVTNADVYWINSTIISNCYSGYIQNRTIFKGALSEGKKLYVCGLEAYALDSKKSMFLYTGSSDIVHIQPSFNVDANGQLSMKGILSFNDTANKPVYYDGTAWVNLDGTALS